MATESKKYRIVESVSRGKIAVAAKDFLPGELILEESEPIMKFTGEYKKRFATTMPQVESFANACFNTYKKVLSQAAQEKIVSLFGPTTGPYAEACREIAQFLNYSDHDDDKYRQLTPEEVEEFVKVASVMRLNMFGSDSHGYSIYAEVTRFSHSCASNCIHIFEGSSCVCFASQHIKEGEELTISYLRDDRDSEPTHIRRQKYLTNKEFTCHCPRCDAPGDDTRQFDCCDSACKGVMIMCQPINHDAILIPGMTYTGVEYVEPYLLPCTVCNATAPAKYQAKMLSLERRLEALGMQFRARFDKIAAGRDVSGYEPLLQEIEATHFPHRHLKSQQLLWVTMCIQRFRYINAIVLGMDATETERCRVVVIDAFQEYMAVQERIFPHPCSNTLSVLTQACNLLVFDWQSFGLPFILPPQADKALMQRTLRMSLVLDVGRVKRIPELDACLLKTLATLPPLQSSDLCAFCEESPLRAAMKRTRCGACKETVYCSAGCQKAHWKLHKKTCKPPTANVK